MYHEFIEKFTVYVGIGIFSMGILFFIFSFIQKTEKKTLREGAFLYVIIGTLLYMHTYKLLLMDLFKKFVNW